MLARFLLKKKIPFLLIYSCPFGFSDATLPSRTITQTAACGQHVFTCAWTTKESRISGAGPAVIQVRVLCQFGSMAGPLMLCLYTQSRFWLLVWQLLFNPIPLAKAPNASLVYLPPAPPPGSSTQSIHKKWCGKRVALVLQFRKLLSHFDLVQNVPGFLSLVWNEKIFKGQKLTFEEFSCSRVPICSGELRGCERSSPQAPLRVPVDPHRQSASPTPSSNNQSR